jgi:DNA-binding NarL/FixJ family response regulator
MVEQTQIKVVIADGRRLVRDLLHGAVSAAPGMSVAGVAATAAAAKEAVARTHPDVVILGVPSLDTAVEDSVHTMLLAHSSAAVVVLVSHENDEELLRALDAGAIGFATLDMPLAQLFRSVQAAAAGETLLPAEFARRVVTRARTPMRPLSGHDRMQAPLTSREAEILELLMKGHGNGEIAGMLGVSVNTVKNHLYSIYRKLGVKSRGQAFVAASQLGYVTT